MENAEFHNPKLYAEMVQVANNASTYFSRLLSVDRLPIHVSERKPQEVTHTESHGDVELKISGVFEGRADPGKFEICVASSDPDLIAHEVAHIYYGSRHPRIQSKINEKEIESIKTFNFYLKGLAFDSIASESFANLAEMVFPISQGKSYDFRSVLRVIRMNKEEISASVHRETEKLSDFLSNGIAASDTGDQMNILVGVLERESVAKKISASFSTYYVSKPGVPEYLFLETGGREILEIKKNRVCLPNVRRLERLIKAAYDSDSWRFAQFVLNKEIKERKKLIEAISKSG